MAQTTYDITANPRGLTLRLRANEIFEAIQTINSGATPPTDTQAGMWWGDISDPNTYYLKMRNHTNDGWVSLYAYDVATSTIRALSNDKYLAEITGATGAVFLPSGTTAQRPTLTSGEKALRYNTDNTELEFWDGTAWNSLGSLDINSLTDKTTPADGDELVLADSDDTYNLKKLSWSNLKATVFASPAFTGTPTAPTPILGDDSTKLATTAFVQANAKSLLAEFTVTGSAVTSLDITGLDINTHKSYILEIDMVGNVDISTVYLFANGDNTITNYYSQILVVNDTSTGVNRQNNPRLMSSIGVGDYQGITLNVSLLAQKFLWRSMGNYRDDTTLGGAFLFGSKIAKITNLTQLTIASVPANGIGVGTTVRIYRGDI